MNKQQATKRIAKLRREIEYHRSLYHTEDRMDISEAALDSLKHELVQLEHQYPDLVTFDSPSQRIGGKPLGKFTKVKHSKPVLSLEDLFSAADIQDWQDRNEKLLGRKVKEYYCELKLDGLTVVLSYNDGIFTRGTTRGDGVIGEDVTNNLKTIEAIPLKLNLSGFSNLPKVIEVRGEVVMSKKNFELLNKEQRRRKLAEFANPRNIAAGSIRQLDPTVAASRKLDCVTFELITDLGQKTHSQVHDWMKKMGFKTSPYNKLCQGLSEVEKYLNSWEKKRHNWLYNTDGAVIVINDIGLERRLGSVGKSERWMAAYKFPAEQTTTKVKDIVVQVGRTGALTPIAVLDPVRVAGSTVSRATLHNQDEIDRLDVRIGDTVIIQKAGDIIPDIVQVLPKLRTGKEKKFSLPKKCPICEQPIIKKSGEVAYYCSNKSCWAQQVQGLIHFADKKAFNIDGLGDKIIEQLVQSGLVRSAADFFRLKKTDLEQLERFAEKSADNLILAIENSKKVTLAKFIYSLGIRHAGEQTAIELAQHFGSINKLQKASEEELAEIADVGPIVAASIYHWLNQEHNRKLITDLITLGVQIINPEMKTKAGVAGKIFVLTGSLSQPRDYYADLIRRAGGKVSGSVSKETDYVVIGDNPGSKADQATKFGVKQLNEASLRKLIS